MQFYTVEDYSSRYKGTWLGVRTGREVHPYYVTHVVRSGDGFAFRGNRIDKDGESTDCTYLTTDESLILHPPDLGMVHHRGSLAYLYRKPHRRWKQGMCFDSLHTRWYVRDIHQSNMQAYCIFNPEYIGLQDALDRACDVHRAGYAVSRYLGVVSSDTEGHCHVVYRSNPVGEYYAENQELILRPGFNPLRDTLRRAGFQNIQEQEEIAL